MKKQELQSRIDEIKWFHRIDLPTDEGEILTTPGVLTAEHCSEEAATNRFGIPDKMDGLKIIDLGANQGYFSFLSENRGATVTAVDPNQGGGDNERGFLLAREAFSSKIDLYKVDASVYAHHSYELFDYVYFFGVLYHLENPIKELKAVSKLTKPGGIALIETTISQEIEISGKRIPYWEFRQGHEGDDTNVFYPNPTAVIKILEYVGFKSVDIIYIHPSGTRATFKAYK